MADQFKLDAKERQKVSDGVRDIESRMAATISTLGGPLAAEGTPWQFAGAPAGIPAHLENIENSADPSKTGSIGAGVADLTDYLDTIVNPVQKSHG